MKRFSEADLIVQSDGSVYHLGLKPGELPETVITVGDPDRVETVSAFFDEVLIIKQSREFLTHIGTYQRIPIAVISTGMGTDNIDILMTEMDALWNIDLSSRTELEKKHSARIIRVGTTGSIHPDVEVGTIGFTQHALGFDHLWPYYKVVTHRLHDYLPEAAVFSPGNDLSLIASRYMAPFVTATMPGFYGPQGREIRIPSVPVVDYLREVRWKGQSVTNMEMETSGIYGLGGLLGHETLSVNAVLANRINGTFTDNSEDIVQRAIELTFKLITHEVD